MDVSITPQTYMNHENALSIAQITENALHTVEMQAEFVNGQLSSVIDENCTTNPEQVCNIISEQVPEPELPLPPEVSQIQNKIRDMQRLQRQQFLQKLEEQQKLYQNISKFNQFNQLNHPKSKPEPEMEKLKLINGNSFDIVGHISSKLNTYVMSTLDKIEKINVDEIKKDLDNLFANINKYNSALDSWYDEKFYFDKKKLYKSIEMTEKNIVAFEKLDFISICYDD